MKKGLLFIVLLLVSSSSYAGYDGLTHHSRANCLSINESISWDKNMNWNIRIYATHFPPNQQQPHVIKEEGVGWRIAALHTKEAYGDWDVWAEHYYRVVQNDEWTLESTFASDCNKWEGWWIKNEPEIE